MQKHTVKIRYDASFEKEVTMTRHDNEEENEFIERIEQDMEKYKNDYLDGYFIEFGNMKIMDWRYS